MNCPNCGALSLVRDTRDLPYTYKGQSTIIPKVEGDYCSACHEVIFTRASGDRYGMLIREFQKQVNAETVSPNFIRDVRKKLDLGQREAGEVFGGGVNAFSRYETGKAEPPLSLVKLLILLDRHPELFDEIRPTATSYT